MSPGRSRDLGPLDSVWQAALVTGALTSTYSTLVSSLGSRHVGRNAHDDWMELGTVLLRDDAIQVRPGWREILAGIAIHQLADLTWTTLFFGPGVGRLRLEKQKALMFTLAVPWAVATAAVEYYLILPWLQPLVLMEVPYWLALVVHLSSAAAYPLFPGVHERLRGTSGAGTRFSRRMATGLGAALGGLAVLGVLGRRDRDPRWPWMTRAAREQDRTFLRHMTAHHELGVWLSRIAADQSAQEELRMLGRLMLVSHVSELDLMRSWWRSWYGGEIPAISPQEHHAMSGMPLPEEIARVAALRGPAFDEHYIPLMVNHHRGAIEMAEREWRKGGDPRLRLLAQAILYTQRNQVARMESLRGKAYANPVSAERQVM